MPNGYKLFITDLDGTLLDASGRVHETDRRAIEALRANGIAVTVCTGRMYSGTRAIVRALGLDGAIACVEGSHIVDAVDDRDLLLEAIDCTTTRLISEAARELELTTFVFAHDFLHHDAAGAELLPYVSIWSPRTRALEHLVDGACWHDEACMSGLVAIGDETQIREMEALLVERAADRVQVASFGIRRTLVGKWAMIVRAAGVSKGSAVRWLARHSGIDVSEVVAVGDWYNDIPMLRAAGKSFAMGQAPEDVASAADELLESDSSTGGGIAEAAERAGLI